jgi:tetratricopeptide (TPR) repeat protein
LLTGISGVKPSVSTEALLTAVLAATRSGTLEELMRRHRPLARRVARERLSPALGAAGDALRPDPPAVELVEACLRWALSRLRPDGQPGLEGIDRVAWLQRTSWRPLLAVMCHFGFVQVPEFRDRYRARADEQAADTLCGLWSVGPSTYYRYLDKGRRLLAEMLFEARPTPEASLSLRRHLTEQVHRRLGLSGVEARRTWHLRQADESQVALPDAASRLWHLLHGGDMATFIRVLEHRRTELAHHPETDLLVECVAREALPPRQRFDLHLAHAAIWRVRDAVERELKAIEQALQVAIAADDPLMLGIAYNALGKFHEQRDFDRAFAYYEESADFLRLATQKCAPGEGREVVAAHVDTLVKLAWLYALRNDSRSRPVLDRAEELRAAHGLEPQVAGRLEQGWGEYWRKAGDLQRAVEHKLRALNIFERLGDRMSVLKTYGNLCAIYGEAKEFERAIAAAHRVLALAPELAVEPETIIATRLNLGATYFWQQRYEAAVEQYQAALIESERAGLPVLTMDAHYNLAEAYYQRFRRSGNAEDERLGDAHTVAAQAVPGARNDAEYVDATRRLKSESLGPGAGRIYDRLLPGEYAAHFHEMAEIQQQRQVLALPAEPQQHIAAHLEIAKAYLTISTKEREAALALIERHNLGDRYAAEFDALRQTFDRTLTREQRLASVWQREVGEWLEEQRRIALLEHLFRDGSVQKSVYARLCGVGLATASKHLATLAERGLLSQTGKGPSTRYTLPE